jgi:hypothetical protein
VLDVIYQSAKVKYVWWQQHHNANLLVSIDDLCELLWGAKKKKDISRRKVRIRYNRFPISWNDCTTLNNWVVSMDFIEVSHRVETHATL